MLREIWPRTMVTKSTNLPMALSSKSSWCSSVHVALESLEFNRNALYAWGGHKSLTPLREIALGGLFTSLLFSGKIENWPLLLGKTGKYTRIQYRNMRMGPQIVNKFSRKELNAFFSSSLFSGKIENLGIFVEQNRKICIETMMTWLCVTITRDNYV